MMSFAAEQTYAYAPPRYPAHLVSSGRLPDGTAVIIRPIHPGDDAIEKAFIDSLSSDTRYNRLLSGRKLTPEEIQRLTRIDYDREMAFIAVTVNGAQARLLGVARYVRDADGNGAEFALVVADAWQRKGVGSLLLGTLLRHAHAAAIGRLHGITLATNEAMQNLARKLGFARKHDPRDATVRELEKTLAAGVAPAAAYPTGGHHAVVAANDEIIAPSDSPRLAESV
jgi:acetyltransferase